MRSWIVVATLVVLAVQPTTGLAQTGAWVSHGPERGTIAALAIDPRSPSIVYAGTLGSGIFKSTEAGESWEDMGPPNAQVVALAIDAVSSLAVGSVPDIITATGTHASCSGSHGSRPRSTTVGGRAMATGTIKALRPSSTPARSAWAC
jgi:hypothetical protein